MLPLSKFLDFIAFNKLFKPTEKVLLAISGGKDSVLMAHLFNEAHFTFGIVHCNFSLRADESDGDEHFTESLAQQLNSPFFKIRFATEQFSKDKKVSIQMAARQLRYDWFEKIRIEFEYDYIALAHHQTDTTETILLNLLRGTGIAGLHGILPKREKLIRPLLFLKREEIDQIIAENQFTYREDSSNSLKKYARNKIRHDVIPKLKELNPLLENTFELNSKRFKEVEEFLYNQTEALRAALFQINPSGDIQIPLDKLQELKPQNLLLYEIFKPYHFSETVLNNLISSWHNQTGKIFESPSHLLLLDRKNLILQIRNKNKAQSALIYKADTEFNWSGCRFKISASSQRLSNSTIHPDQIYLDESMLHFPLKMRHWNKGDYFYPFGMKGKKKLSDYFISLKIPLTAKNEVPILENGNGDIIWVAGYRSDERYKISPHTKKVIIFEKYKIDEH